MDAYPTEGFQTESHAVHPSFNNSSMLKIDASGTMLRVVLAYEEGQEEKPIAYANHKLLPYECWYSTIEENGNQ